MEELRSAIRDIIGGILFKPDVVIEDSPSSVSLSLSIERILLYRLQGKLKQIKSLLSDARNSR